MAFFVFLYKLHLKILYFFLKLFPVNHNKVVFLSRNHDTPSLDFRMLENELKSKYKNIQIVFLTKRINKSVSQLICYYFHTLLQTYHIATTNVCVLDSYIIPISILKHRESLSVIQLWHAMGAIKKFGYQTLDKRYGRRAKLSLMMHMHENYDYVVSGTDAMIPFYTEAFHVSSQRFLPIGLPRIDYIVSRQKSIRRSVYKKYPHLKDKPVILYVPTFRLEPDDGIERLVNQIDFSRYSLIIKKHPNDQRECNDDRITFIGNVSSLSLLTVADYIITDYSAISIEASALEKRLYFYVYDYDKYCASNGLNIDLYEQMPGCVFKDAAELIQDIQHNNYNFEAIRAFKRKYVANNGDTTQKISNLIAELAGFRHLDTK